MFESRDRVSEDQQEFWVETRRLPKATASTFYRKLDDTLNDIGFIEGVREICRPAYADAEKGGRPGIDPAVYFKMLMIGFFENLPSERSIASRCADSLSLRAFLGYELDERTPDHSSLTVIRQRLGQEIYQAAFELVLTGLYQYGLLKGRHLGIDSSIIEANASLRELVSRNTEEEYWKYVKRLAAEAGIDPDDTKSVRRFDKKAPVARPATRTGSTLTIRMPRSASPSTELATWSTNPNTSPIWKAGSLSWRQCAREMRVTRWVCHRE
jgi:transposase